MEHKRFVICITTYNRQETTIKTIHRLLPFAVRNNVGISVYNDGGNEDILKPMIDLMNEKVNCIYYQRNENLGVYRSKVKNLIQAINEFTPQWIIHCDDDDYLDLSTLDKIMTIDVCSNMTTYAAIQFNVTRLFQHKSQYHNKLEHQVKKSREITLCLNGLLINVDAIKPRLNNYLNDDIAGWSNKVESWGDDVLIPGYLYLDTNLSLIRYCYDVLGFQEYISDDYHICSDPDVYKRTRDYCRKYIMHIPLKNRVEL